MIPISFSHTAGLVEAGVKTVTRRLGWRGLRAGTRLRAVDRLPRFGGPVRELGTILVISAEQVRLDTISRGDVVKEGFRDHSSAQFVDFYTRAFKCDPDALVTRIEFRLESAPAFALT